MPLYFEDLFVGQKFFSGTMQLTARDIITFATQFDPQPFHTDEAAARESYFRGLAASGWHTASTTMRLLEASVPIAGGLIGGRIEELLWPRPVRPGDTLRVESEVLSIRASSSRPGIAWMRLREITFNQRDEVVQSLVSNVMVTMRGTTSSAL